MHIIKKIAKILLILASIILLIIFIDLSKHKIGSLDDISDIKKVRMYDSENNVFYEINNHNEATYINLNEISENLIKTVIHIEDKRFYNHHGFDIYRIFAAMINNLKGNTLSGASTITQQYVKNVYLSSDKNILRKIRELYFSIQIDSIYEKDDILEGYLNTIYFNHGIYGIHDASYYFFNKHPLDLTLAESATLIAIIKAPTFYSPIIDFNKNQTRKNQILKTMFDDKIITIKEYNIAINEEIKITKTKHTKYSDSVLFYKDIVLKEIEKMAISSQKLDIYTSYDTKLNESITTYIKENNIISDYAIVTLDNNSFITSIITNDYKINQFNIATNGKRMIGSTIKPFLYYEALKSGLTPLSTFYSREDTIYINNEAYKFNNYNNKYQNDKITMAYALATSDNIYAVKTHLYIGSNKLINFLDRFNIKDVNNYPSLALGTAEMSLLELSNIYNTFSNLGVYKEPKTIRYLVSDNRKYNVRYNEQRLLDKNTSYVITDLLTYTFDPNLGGKINPTGITIANRLETKMAGKSGLTDFDSYMVGYNPLFTIGIWTGHKNNDFLTDYKSKSFPKEAFLHITNFLSGKNKNIWYDAPNDLKYIFTSPTGFNTSYKKKIYLLN